MRGEREQACLDRIKNNLRNVCFYGTSIKDVKFIKNCLSSAIPNPESSKFPDFIFKGGFIEHFQITSSETNRKGAVHQKEYAYYRKNTDSAIKEFQEEMNENPSFDVVQEKHWFFGQPAHSYENLVYSFKSTWDSHIESLQKYSQRNGVGIFLVDYPEFALAMSEDAYTGVKEGLRYDDIRIPQKFKAYRLSRDKKMLDYLYTYKEQITFVVYIYYDGYEIIKLENIPELKKLLPWDFTVYTLAVRNVESIYGISVPTE